MESTNDSPKLLHGQVTEPILAGFFAVYNELGFGFLESVYRVALERALREKGVKAVRTILPEHRAQLLHYLKATRMEVGMLLNFGRNPAFQRLIFTQRTEVGIATDQ